MRPIWSGLISFGLVNIPVRLYSAVEAEKISFDLIHKKDNSPIGYSKVCKNEGVSVSNEEIAKGYKYGEDSYVLLEDADIEKANVKKSKTLEILSFTLQEEIDPIYFEKPYYLEPADGAEKPYILLKEALDRTGKVGIAKFVIRNREHIGILKPVGKLLLLDQLRFSYEIRPTEELKIPEGVSIKPEELEIAISLVDKLTKAFKIEEYHDTFLDDLRDIIAQKARGKLVKAKGIAPKMTPAQDIMELLKASLEKE